MDRRGTLITAAASAAVFTRNSAAAQDRKTLNKPGVAAAEERRSAAPRSQCRQRSSGGRSTAENGAHDCGTGCCPRGDQLEVPRFVQVEQVQRGPAFAASGLHQTPGVRGRHDRVVDPGHQRHQSRGHRCCRGAERARNRLSLRDRQRGRVSGPGTLGPGPGRLVDLAPWVVPLLPEQAASAGPARCVHRLSVGSKAFRSPLGASTAEAGVYQRCAL